MLKKSICFAAVFAALVPAFVSADEHTIMYDKTELTKYLKNHLVPAEMRMDESIFGQCVTWGDVAILHSPFESEAEIDAFVAQLPDLDPTRYQINGSFPRITTTATNGSGIGSLVPMTITYSFVPDGTSIPIEPSVPGSTTGPSNLFATMNGAFGSEAVWKPRFALAFDRISQLTGIDYVEVTDDGATFLSSPGSNTGGIRGDVRISMRPFSGANGVLAYNFFPNTSDMVIDSQDIGNWSNSGNNFRVFRNTLMHEHGHGLGYNHVDPAPPSGGSGTKLMEAFLATGFDGPQQDDIRGLQRQYGDTSEPNDTVATAAHLGTLPPPFAGGTIPDTLVLTNHSIEFPAEVDVYSFNVPNPGMLLTIGLLPIGSTYSQGPQGGSTTSVNALAINNLQYEIIAPDGVTVLLTDNDAAAGANENHSNLNLAPHGAGNYYMRVSSVSAVNDVQRYNITLSYLPPAGVSEWSAY